MQANQLIFTSLENALNQLMDGFDYFQSAKVQNDRRAYIHTRAGVIQAFEFTYEQAWKMLKRFLELTEPTALEVEQMSFANLIRTGCERGLIKSNLDQWLDYRKERGATSHTYDEDKANEVIETIPDFIQDVQYLLQQLKQASA